MGNRERSPGWQRFVQAAEAIRHAIEKTAPQSACGIVNRGQKSAGLTLTPARRSFAAIATAGSYQQIDLAQPFDGVGRVLRLVQSNDRCGEHRHPRRFHGQLDRSISAMIERISAITLATHDMSCARICAAL
jgi:hypothetical protein